MYLCSPRSSVGASGGSSPVRTRYDCVASHLLGDLNEYFSRKRAASPSLSEVPGSER